MLGALIGAGVSLAGQGINAILGARQAARQQRELDKQERDNQAWYDRRYNEVGHERADAQRLLTKMADAQRQRTLDSAGRSAVIGSSSAIRAAGQQADGKAMADTVAQIDAAQEARRDKIDAQYNATKQAISKARAGLAAQQSANIANAATGASLAGAQIAAAGLDANPFRSVWDTPDGNSTSTTTATPGTPYVNPYTGETIDDAFKKQWRHGTT